MKPVEFLGSSQRDLADFPTSARRIAGFELRKVQAGAPPRDAKPMPTIGPGVQELRIWVEEGTFRVIYVARFADAMYVLHVFEKKTQATSRGDLTLARQRYREISQMRRSNG